MATEELREAGQILIPFDEAIFVESGQNILGAGPLYCCCIGNEFPFPKHEQVGKKQDNDGANRNSNSKLDRSHQAENRCLFDGMPIVNVPVFMSKNAAQCSVREGVNHARTHEGPVGISRIDSNGDESLRVHNGHVHQLFPWGRSGLATPICGPSLCLIRRSQSCTSFTPALSFTALLEYPDIVEGCTNPGPPLWLINKPLAAKDEDLPPLVSEEENHQPGNAPGQHAAGLVRQSPTQEHVVNESEKGTDREKYEQQAM
nr:hypothetical protein [Azospira sp. I09]